MQTSQQEKPVQQDLGNPSWIGLPLLLWPHAFHAPPTLGVPDTAIHLCTSHIPSAHQHCCQESSLPHLSALPSFLPAQPSAHSYSFTISPPRPTATAHYPSLRMPSASPAPHAGLHYKFSGTAVHSGVYFSLSLSPDSNLSENKFVYVFIPQYLASV